MDMSEVIFLGLLLDMTSGIGAFLFGFVDDRLGGKTTIQITILGPDCRNGHGGLGSYGTLVLGRGLPCWGFSLDLISRRRAH